MKELLERAWTLHVDELWIEALDEDGMVIVDPPSPVVNLTDEGFLAQKAIMEHIVTLHNQWLLEPTGSAP